VTAQAARSDPSPSLGSVAHTEPGGPQWSTLATRIALIVALVCLLQPGLPARPALLAAIGSVVLLVASARWRVGWLALVLLLVAGVALRLEPAGGFSDVLTVTQAAIREMLAGGNPYGHGFAESVPPGAPFAYGPVALAWYLPVLDVPGTLERLAAVIVLVGLAVRGRPLGLAIYAVMPALVGLTGDGSNDTSAGLMLLVALLACLRWPIGGAVLLAVATAFKPYALAWLPGLLAYAGSLLPLLAFILASALVWLVPMLRWGGEAMLWSFRRADAVHASPYYSLAYALGGEWLPQPAWQGLRIAAGVLVAVLGLRWVTSAASFIILGSLVFLATLFLGWWGTFAYLAAVAPIVCWHIDDWLGLRGGRVVWPGDPVGRATAWVDGRWPVRRPDRGSIVTEPSRSAG
jgi:hypothetical protein